MSHHAQVWYCNYVKSRFPEFFQNSVVLDVGSLDINGSNKSLFDSSCQYTGLDLAPGKNVDIVGKGHELKHADGFYRTIISTEMLEHDMYWKDTLQNMLRMLSSNGLLLLTCATTGRPEHGTQRTSPGASPFTAETEGWQNYYRNLVEADFRSVWDVEATFRLWSFEADIGIGDIRFWGIKR